MIKRTVENTLRHILSPLSLLLCLSLTFAFTACEEVEEVGAYDNWQARNEAYIDSIASQISNRYIATEEAVMQVPVGEMFAIRTEASSSEGEQYVYCKKIVDNPAGRRPLYTESVSAYYYGTVITGASFDGNFEGYSAIDQQELNATDKGPTDFDSPTTFSISGVVAGWTAALQLMHTGERWMLYVPYQSGYGTSEHGSIPAYSTLVFDILLEEVVEE